MKIKKANRVWNVRFIIYDDNTVKKHGIERKIVESVKSKSLEDAMKKILKAYKTSENTIWFVDASVDTFIDSPVIIH